MKVIDLEGTSYERGVAQGRAILDGWHELEAEFFASHLFKDAKPWFVPVPVVRMLLDAWGWNLSRPSVKKYLPAQYERVNGLARGLDISRHRAWGIHYVELLLCLSTSSLDIPDEHGCTQAHVSPAASANGKPLLARNYDFPNLLQHYQVVRRDKPSEPGRFATTTVTQMPLAGAHHGVNERGLAVCVNNNRAIKEYNKHGVPYMLLLMETLETCSTAAEAVGFLSKFPARANSGFFGVMDPTGDCRVIEFTAVRTAVREPDDKGIIAQTNHFITMTDANLPDDATWNVPGMKGIKYSASTKARYEATRANLRKESGGITVDTLKKILADHSADPSGKGDFNCVCCHGESGSTLCGIIVEPETRSLWVADGFPCSASFEKVEFKS